MQYKKGLTAASINAAPNHGLYTNQAVAITNNDTETERAKFVEDVISCGSTLRSEENLDMTTLSNLPKQTNEAYNTKIPVTLNFQVS